MSNLAVNPREHIGANNPPAPTTLERAQHAMDALAVFLNANPVIEGGEQLVAAKALVERARGAMAELEAERDKLVRPLNEEVAAVNGKYKAIHNTDPKKPGVFDKVLTELKSRLTAYAKVEEAKREREAELLRIEQARAEHEAREAERLEAEAKANAGHGELDTGVVQAIENADQKFSEFEAVSRFAARAEKAVPVRIGGGVGKAMSMRTEKTLVLDSYGKAITAIGPNEKIRDAILSAARDYRKEHGKLPDGVSETSERKF